MADLFEEIVKIQRSGEKAALATVVVSKGSAPRREGAKMLIKADGSSVGTVGGGALEFKVYNEAMKMMNDGEPQMIHFELNNTDAAREGQLCGGTVDVFLEPLKPASALVIFGGGHISYFLAKIGKIQGFRIVVVDDREEFANQERFPEADQIVAEPFASAVGRLAINEESYVVIVTRGHLHDSEILEWAVTTNAAYVGMIGSHKKVKDVFKYLESKGVTKEQLAKVHAPIGLPINAETPEEITISILAEIIQVRRALMAGKKSATCGATADNPPSAKL